jgi:glycosyltransferase involved in cell wall biosynthesis
MPDATQDLISVIMPCYNAASFVEEAAMSVLGQTYRNVELIIVDDGSTDSSISVIERLREKHFDRVRLFRQDRKGPYPARNAGLAYAKGTCVAFLDADDWWRKDCLELLHGALENGQADVAYCGWQNIGDPLAVNTEAYIPPDYGKGDLLASFLRTCPWPIHAALVRRQALDAVGGFSESHFSSMDYDLWLRIIAYTQKISLVPEVMAYYRWHGATQISAAKSRQVMDALRVRRSFVKRYPDKVAHLSSDVLYDLVNGQVMREAYKAYWRRDLENAQKLLRTAFFHGIFAFKDLKYILLALLPQYAFMGLVSVLDKRGVKA